MARDMAEKDILTMEVTQLKKEVSTARSSVAAACKETIEFVEAQSPEDPLIKGVPEATNPYKEKGGCIIS